MRKRAPHGLLLIVSFALWTLIGSGCASDDVPEAINTDVGADADYDTGGGDDTETNPPEDTTTPDAGPDGAMASGSRA